MTGHPALLDQTEGRRVEALRRLDVDGTGPEAGLDDTVRLLADLVGAAVVNLTFVRQETAWVKATTAPAGQVEAARHGSPAADACAAVDGRATRTIAADDPLATHPSVAGIALPATCVAVAVRAPEGERVGALEVLWEGRHDPDPELLGFLDRFAAHAGHVLETRAVVSEYRRFIELFPDPVILLDADGIMTHVNPALARLLGSDHVHDLEGRRFLEVVAPPDRARVVVELSRVPIERHHTVRFDLQLLAADGRPRRCSVSAAHLRGSRRNLQLVIHDLSDHLREEDERSRLSEQLARAQQLEAVGQVAGGLAHDLNNLLVVMVSCLSLAEESLADAAERIEDEVVGSLRQDLGELQLAIDRATGLTSELVRFARREDSERSTTDLVDAVETVRGLVTRMLGGGIDLVVTLADDLPPVAADPIGLERALVNLVINARDAIAGRGTIRIEAERTTLGPDGLEPHGPCRDALRLSVIDDGCGMDAMTRARAFDPLFTTKGDLGSGLGLATVLAFVDEVEGGIDLASVPGVGTRITLTVPLAERPVEPCPMTSATPVVDSGVLLVPAAPA